MKRLAPSLVVLVLASCAHPVKAPPRPPAAPEIAWVENDYGKALALARETHRPLVVDFWAVWCHFCTSAEGYTFKDPSVVALRDRFVWVRINTDEPANGDMLAKVKIAGLPTYLVLDPTDESIVGRWLGSGTPRQFTIVLRDAEMAYRGTRAGSLAADDPLRLFLLGSRASSAGEHASAAEFFAKSVKAAPENWDRRADALAAEVDELAALEKFREAVTLALSLPRAEHGSGIANALDSAAGVLGKLPAAESKRFAASLEDRMLSLVIDPAATLAADERSNLWSDIGELRKMRGDEKGAHEALLKELAVLEDAMKGAPDPATASGFSSARAHALVELGRGEDAITLLKETEKQLPTMADPPARLARVYQKLGRLDEALAAIERAISRAPAGYAARLLSTRAAILLQARGPEAFCAGLQKVLDAEAALPESERSADVVADAKEKLASCNVAKSAPAGGR